MQAEDPYATPESALEREDSNDPLTRLDEAMVDFMSSSRPRTIVFIALAGVGCVASIAGIAEALLFGAGTLGVDRIDSTARAIVWLFVLAHCALAGLVLARYLTAVNRVARSNDRRDLNLALERRRSARVGWFVMIALLIVSLFLPLFYVR